MEYETALKNYENQQEEIQHHKRFIDRFRASAARAASVQSRIKMLNAMERFQKPEKPFTLEFEFPQCSHVSGDVISLRNVTFGYNSKEILLNGISQNIGLDSRIGVIGANGAGKSTLISLMLEQLKPIKGDVVRNRKARIAVFTQHHIDQLDLSMSPMDFLLAKFADDCRSLIYLFIVIILSNNNKQYIYNIEEKRPAEYIRNKLGAFGLSGEIVNQRMVFLSGGQKSRVAFTILTWEIPHFIIMDEPTNHLDMETIDALIGAIHKWNGGILVVSHDQHFLMSAAKKFWSLSIKSGTIEEFVDLGKAKDFASHRA
ncbi:hypothetical protein RFI_27002 [Reticulomyxa filosa]|uniref:ABC transporter domain-containing protein n=1 Tax=Reticulomyxa filosa TaxID=46433 RepID=X6M935_RETFI|nr:hypothetical protein RFI_27002 [Reticulomyxa filosa]|eukprot:ETO10374.1 hypothetical protein RFI_27002 [Reticulomyxa filosa]